jgi:hypothetical protein
MIVFRMEAMTFERLLSTLEGFESRLFVLSGFEWHVELEVLQQ